MVVRKPFNWSLLTRDALFCMLNSIQSKVVDQRLSVEKLHELMAKHIKRHMPIKVKMDRDPKNDKGYVYVGGTYYSDCDQDRKKSIGIVLAYNK